MKNGPIGIFDSGMGGLTVMRALKEKLPGEHFTYLGDTARLPYGTKSADTVLRYVRQASGALVARGVKMIVIACNTASGVALPMLQDALGVPVAGVILPGARAAVTAAHDGAIAILATEGTVKGGAYVRAIDDLGGHAVVQQACPLFVPMAEEGLIDGPIVEGVTHRYLDPVLAMVPKPSVMVLGCTHFPVLAPVIARVAGPGVTLVDSAATTADAVADLLRAQDMMADTPGVDHFLVTDAPDRFARVGGIFLGRAIDPGAVELIDLQ